MQNSRTSMSGQVLSTRHKEHKSRMPRTKQLKSSKEGPAEAGQVSLITRVWPWIACKGKKGPTLQHWLLTSTRVLRHTGPSHTHINQKKIFFFLNFKSKVERSCSNNQRSDTGMILDIATATRTMSSKAGKVKIILNVHWPSQLNYLPRKEKGKIFRYRSSYLTLILLFLEDWNTVTFDPRNKGYSPAWLCKEVFGTVKLIFIAFISRGQPRHVMGCLLISDRPGMKY